MNPFVKSAVVSSFVLLSACGGGGDSSGGSEPPTNESSATFPTERNLLKAFTTPGIYQMNSSVRSADLNEDFQSLFVFTYNSSDSFNQRPAESFNLNFRGTFLREKFDGDTKIYFKKTPLQIVGRKEFLDLNGDGVKEEISYAEFPSTALIPKLLKVGGEQQIARVMNYTNSTKSEADGETDEIVSTQTIDGRQFTCYKSQFVQAVTVNRVSFREFEQLCFFLDLNNVVSRIYYSAQFEANGGVVTLTAKSY